jgi:hypothetical protein
MLLKDKILIEKVLDYNLLTNKLFFMKKYNNFLTKKKIAANTYGTN